MNDGYLGLQKSYFFQPSPRRPENSFRSATGELLHIRLQGVNLLGHFLADATNRIAA